MVWSAESLVWYYSDCEPSISLYERMAYNISVHVQRFYASLLDHIQSLAFVSSTKQEMYYAN